MPKKRKKMAQIGVSSTVVACAFVYTAPVNDKISQRLVLNSAAYRNTRHHLLRVPSSALSGSVVQRITAGLNLQLPQLKLLLTARDYAGIGTMRDGTTALDRGLGATLCVPRAEASQSEQLKVRLLGKKMNHQNF